MRSKIGVICATLLIVPSIVLAQDTESEIEAGSEAWQEAWNAGDAAAIASLYAENAVLLPPGAEPVTGREAIQAFWQTALDEQAGVTGELETVEVHDFGDAAVEVGSYVDTGPGGEHVDHGKYVAIWKKLDGEWKIIRDIFNSSMAR